jgi:hypothetical protein
MSKQDSVRPSERKFEKAAPVKTRPMHCSVKNCGMPAICRLEERHLCLPHFIAHCYDRLQRCKRSPFPNPDSADFCAEDCFLQECSERAAELVCPLRGFDNLERARLFDIFLWASELRANRAVLQPEREVDLHVARGAAGT